MIEGQQSPLRTGTFGGHGGAEIRHGWWPAVGRPRGTLLLLPGRTENIEKYDETARWFAARGWFVRAIDWRGQGLSFRDNTNPQAMWIDDFQTHVLDLSVWLATEPDGMPDPPGPRVLVSHSMGGTIALLAIKAMPDLVSRAVLVAPMLGVQLPAPRWILGPFSRLMSFLGHSKRYCWGRHDYVPSKDSFDGNLLTSDPVRYGRQRDSWAAKPELQVGGVTWGWLAAGLAAAEEATAFLARSRVPTRLLLAGEEAIVDNRIAEAAAAAGPCAEREIVARARHEILMEVDALRVPALESAAAFLEND